MPATGTNAPRAVSNGDCPAAMAGAASMARTAEPHGRSRSRQVALPSLIFPTPAVRNRSDPGPRVIARGVRVNPPHPAPHRTGLNTRDMAGIGPSLGAHI